MPVLVVCFVLLCSLVPAAAQETSWEKQWNETIRLAKKEGKVVVFGPPNPDVRRDLPTKFTARFGIPLEYIGGRSAELIPRLRTERLAGIYTVDAGLPGMVTAQILHHEKMLDPVRDVLILPEVVNPAKWKRGKLWFDDPEEKYLLRLLNTVAELFFINTRHVKPQEITSIKDLIHPKWKGKISVLDPTAPGIGPVAAARLYVELGEEFVKKLYIEQEPAITRDSRQLTDWLARGTYPIAYSLSAQVEELQKEGIPIMAFYSLPDFPHPAVSSAGGLLALFNKAPHPNAARLFINWMASKEGLETFARPQANATTRNDIDESFVPPEEIPHPGGNYFDNTSWEFSNTVEKVRLRMKELLKR